MKKIRKEDVLIHDWGCLSNINDLHMDICMLTGDLMDKNLSRDICTILDELNNLLWEEMRRLMDEISEERRKNDDSQLKHNV